MRVFLGIIGVIALVIAILTGMDAFVMSTSSSISSVMHQAYVGDEMTRALIWLLVAVLGMGFSIDNRAKK